MAFAQDVSQMDVVPYLVPPLPQGERHAYGRDAEQRLTLTVPRSPSPPAVVVIIENDSRFAEESKSANTDWIPIALYDRGLAVARLNHRRGEKVGAAAVMEDLVAGLARLRLEASRQGADPSRLILIGKGDGAHYALLAGTDPAYLGAASIPFANLRAIVAINAAGFDIPTRIASSSRYRALQYQRVFGLRSADQQAYSPSAHLAAPNVARIRLYAVEEEFGDFATQANEIAAALTKAGSQATVRPLARDRDSASSSLGAPQHPETAQLLAFLEAAAR